ncbi:MAG: hypothetical protein IKB42_05750 [Clostridia bacterium]|nr:hypothetical protein [Clostridia bacterium]
MNTCALNYNSGVLASKYILLLTKCEKLHSKLEKLYSKENNSNIKKQQILYINNSLNKLLVELMLHQYKLELSYQ